MTPPLPSPPITAPTRRIASVTLASPTGDRVTAQPKLAATASIACVVARLVTTGPGVFASTCCTASSSVSSSPIGLAALGDHGEAVGVHVLREADIAARARARRPRAARAPPACGSAGRGKRAVGRDVDRHRPRRPAPRAAAARRSIRHRCTRRCATRSRRGVAAAARARRSPPQRACRAHRAAARPDASSAPADLRVVALVVDVEQLAAAMRRSGTGRRRRRTSARSTPAGCGSR